MTKKRYFEITLGVICSLIIWILSVVLSGEILAGDILELGYSHLGLGKIYVILFLAYNIGMAIYAKKKGRKALFMGACVTIAIPVISYLILFLSYFTGISSDIIGNILYVPAMLAATAIYIYAKESVAMTVVSGVVICISPIISILVYKRTKPSKQ